MNGKEKDLLARQILHTLKPLAPSIEQVTDLMNYIENLLEQKRVKCNEGEWTGSDGKHEWAIMFDGESTFKICDKCGIKLSK